MPVVNKTSPTQSKTTTQTKTGSVLSRIAPVSFNEKKDATCIYGISGTGKTTLACTYPKPLLLIGAEDGTRSVHSVKGVDFIRLKNSGELPEVIAHVRSSGKYKAVVLDTCTSLQAMIMAEILGMEELPVQLSWGLATRDQWGQSAMKTKEFLRHTLKLSEDNICHSIILAQERAFGEGGDSELIAPKVMASLTGSTVGWLNPACDYIVQTFLKKQTIKKEVKIAGKVNIQNVDTGKVDYCLRTRPHELYLIKFRVPKGKEPPEYIIDPDYDKLDKLVRGIS